MHTKRRADSGTSQCSLYKLQHVTDFMRFALSTPRRARTSRRLFSFCHVMKQQTVIHCLLITHMTAVVMTSYGLPTISVVRSKIFHNVERDFFLSMQVRTCAFRSGFSGIGSAITWSIRAYGHDYKNINKERYVEFCKVADTSKFIFFACPFLERCLRLLAFRGS